MPMPDPIDQLDVVYCRGWDASARAVVGPLTPELARAQDDAGTPYSVLLLAAARLVAVIEVAWSSHSCAIWRLDEHGRRDARRELRLLEDGKLFLLEQKVWGYADVEQPEFDPTASVRKLCYTPDGTVRDGYAERG